MRSSRRGTVAILCGLLLTSGCSMRTIAVRQTANILKDSLPVFETESDLEFVELALPASIKTIEALLLSDPENYGLLLMLARAYTAFGHVIMEDRFEEAQLAAAKADQDDSPLVARLKARTKAMYLRAHAFGVRALESRREGYRAALVKGRESLDKYLAGADKDDVGALFWSTMPLAAAMNIDRDDIKLLAMMPKVRAVMLGVVKLDEGYYFGGAHMVLGALFGSVGKMLGGDTERAKRHFEKALALTNRRFLLVHEMYARSLAVQIQDKALFKKLLEEALAADPKVLLPEQRLANIAAKRRAKRTLAKLDELF